MGLVRFQCSMHVFKNIRALLYNSELRTLQLRFNCSTACHRDELSMQLRWLSCFAAMSSPSTLTYGTPQNPSLSIFSFNSPIFPVRNFDAWLVSSSAFKRAITPFSTRCSESNGSSCILMADNCWFVRKIMSNNCSWISVEIPKVDKMQWFLFQIASPFLPSFPRNFPSTTMDPTSSLDISHIPAELSSFSHALTFSQKRRRVWTGGLESFTSWKNVDGDRYGLEISWMYRLVKRVIWLRYRRLREKEEYRGSERNRVLFFSWFV